MKQGKFKAFFASDAAGGIVLMLSAALAMLAANSLLSGTYTVFQEKTLLIINDLLMAFFFLYAGLEIKRELVVGALSSRQKAILPLIAAACGMIVPAIIYTYILREMPELHHGWAIPAATDIAFSLGVLALAASRLPPAIKVLLMAIAVMDDLGAILVIAFFYTDTLNLMPLLIAAIATMTLVVMNLKKVEHFAPYFAAAGVLGVGLFFAGIHPTIAGVTMGFCVPMHRAVRLQHHLHKPVTYLVLPLFGFANAGVSLAGIGMDDLFHPLALGIGLGLVAGKQIGIFGSIYMCVKTKLCVLPEGVTWLQVYGMSILCGIGFTMALFVGGLSFSNPAWDVYIRMGVIGGSVVSALLGYTVLNVAARSARS